MTAAQLREGGSMLASFGDPGIPSTSASYSTASALSTLGSSLLAAYLPLRFIFYAIIGAWQGDGTKTNPGLSHAPLTIILNNMLLCIAGSKYRQKAPGQVSNPNVGGN